MKREPTNRPTADDKKGRVGACACVCVCVRVRVHVRVRVCVIMEE